MRYAYVYGIEERIVFQIIIDAITDGRITVKSIIKRDGQRVIDPLPA